ncbi:MAG: hypothetical protein ACRD4R_00895 [Candidatus Acidiferrales bacterium]
MSKSKQNYSGTLRLIARNKHFRYQRRSDGAAAARANFVRANVTPITSGSGVIAQIIR